MPKIGSLGALSSRGFGEFAQQTSATYIEDVFSTYLYTGNSSGQLINNGINLGTNYSGTTLLLPYDSNTTDTANGFTPVVTGSAAFTTAASKFGGGSLGGFNGSSWLDYYSQAGNFGSGNWTVEFWLNTTTTGNPGVVTQAYAGGAATTSWGFFIGYGSANNLAFYMSDGTSYFASITAGTTNVRDGAWHHCAASRSGSTVYLFLDGVLQGTASVGTTAFGNGAYPIRVGGQGTSYSLTSGYIDDLRIVKGTAVYTSNFTPPSAPLSLSSYPPNNTAGAGGMVWTKPRVVAAEHELWDTNRGVSNYLVSNTTAANVNLPGLGFGGYGLNAFTPTGFALGDNWNGENTNASNIASWTWRKTPKFFDVATFTSNSSGGATVSHNLGSSPGMVIVKSTGVAENWWVWHRSLTNTQYLILNTTNAIQSGAATITVSSTNVVFSNAWLSNSTAYVMYVFAHNAGGFGLDGTQNVISCGSYTGNGSATGPTVTLGYEPQWLLIKKATGAADDWLLIDNMRGFPVSSGQTAFVNPNTSLSESTFATLAEPNSTGFQVRTTDSTVNTNGATYIYMAIRRGPMKVPTDATTVFSPTIYTGDYNTITPVTNMLPATDVWWNAARTIASSYFVMDRLRGWRWFNTPSIAAETSSPTWSQPTQTTLLPSSSWWGGSQSNVNYFFKRAPGFMDEVCYTGTGSSSQIPHNLQVVPELIITKARSTSNVWFVDRPNNLTIYNQGVLNNSDAFYDNWLPTGMLATATTFRPSQIANGTTYVAYLFASCPGVSKVGTYTGTGATQTISCGFTGGARYVLIKRIDNTGSWWVWDTARGMIAGTDPRIPTNSASAETNANWVYTTTGGFQIVTSDATINANGGTYLYLSIA